MSQKNKKGFEIKPKSFGLTLSGVASILTLHLAG